MSRFIAGRTLAVKLSTAVMATLFCGALQATAKDVGITENTMEVEYSFNGQTYVISRNQDQTNHIPDRFALTSRPCPGHCLQPMSIH
jgi:hypothetical protein